jgi:hypothetical protein
MAENQNPVISLVLNNSTLKSYIQQIDEKFFKSLFVVCNENEKLFIKYNLEEFNLKINFKPILYSDSIVRVLISTVPKNDQIEEATVGLAFCLLFKLYNEITEIECYQAEGEGFDYTYRVGDNFYKIEMSGTNTDKPSTFISRISEKRRKFMNGDYWDDNYEKEEIFIVDFQFNKYTYWDSKEHNNLKRGINS